MLQIAEVVAPSSSCLHDMNLCCLLELRRKLAAHLGISRMWLQKDWCERSFDVYMPYLVSR